MLCSSLDFDTFCKDTNNNAHGKIFFFKLINR